MECGEAGCYNGKCATTSCTPSWNCGQWSSCTKGKQSRTCTDTKCNQATKTETQSCSSVYPFSDYPLILIHGLNIFDLLGNPASLNNLQDSLKNYYEDKGVFYTPPSCEKLLSDNKPIMINYGYDTAAQSFESIGGFASDLAAFIKKVQECTNAPKVDIIAHSQGGAVARYSIKYNNIAVNKLITLGTPTHCISMKKQSLLSSVQLSGLTGFYNTLNQGDETCCGTNYYVIRGDTGNGDDGIVSASCADLDGAIWRKDVNCEHSALSNPLQCPQAYNYILEALSKSKSLSTPTENAVKDKTQTPQVTNTETRYCYKRFLGFLWCMEYRYR